MADMINEKNKSANNKVDVLYEILLRMGDSNLHTYMTFKKI
jgi:hypothetical protein